MRTWIPAFAGTTNWRVGQLRNDELRNDELRNDELQNDELRNDELQNDELHNRRSLVPGWALVVALTTSLLPLFLVSSPRRRPGPK
jgi:hypothetical protein